MSGTRADAEIKLSHPKIPQDDSDLEIPPETISNENAPSIPTPRRTFSLPGNGKAREMGEVRGKLQQV